ncbi:MAG: IS110 family transposase, partial [Selenomonadaceae bacterium]|nr:IS110 family transposase [Selenomonadaceae bacterium]
KFSSVPKFVAYAGLYRKSRQSGESKTDGRMSKRGSPYLRRAVWLAAFKDHLTVIGHVCHKMLAIIKPYLPASTS